ncbi:MAG TPA: rod shape-determining protein [Armatimonadota bacterium]|nr:rod shape-determining protein [Armatimonadota bacterium]
MQILKSLFGHFSRDVGIDLGTANTVVHVRGKGIMLREPSVIAINRNNRTVELRAVGFEAKEMLGRTPVNVVALRPLRDGVIGDIDNVELMLKRFLQMATRRRDVSGPRVVVGVPSGATEVEELAVSNAAKKAGAGETFPVAEPMLAAIGAGLPVHEPTGNMIVDIGGGTTEVAVISLGGIVTYKSIRIAGDEIDEAIAAYTRKVYNLYIGERTAEEVKLQIGSAYPIGEETSMVVRGRDLVTGLPRSATLRSEEVRECIQEPVRAVVEAVKVTLENTPPELAADIMDRGIILSGGGALLRGLDRLIMVETEMPVHLAEDPLSCVAKGAGQVLEDPQMLRQLRHRYHANVAA